MWGEINMPINAKTYEIARDFFDENPDRNNTQCFVKQDNGEEWILMPVSRDEVESYFKGKEEGIPDNEWDNLMSAFKGDRR